jgi:hypothetical protein
MIYTPPAYRRGSRAHEAHLCMLVMLRFSHSADLLWMQGMLEVKLSAAWVYCWHVPWDIINHIKEHCKHTHTRTHARGHALPSGTKPQADDSTYRVSLLEKIFQSFRLKTPHVKDKVTHCSSGRALPIVTQQKKDSRGLEPIEAKVLTRLYL